MWRGPVVVLDIDETGAAGRLQARTVKVARDCARKRLGLMDPASRSNGGLEVWPCFLTGQGIGRDATPQFVKKALCRSLV